VVDILIAMAVGQLGQATSSKITVHGARDVQFSDMQTDANFILLGSPRSNPWSNLYNDRLDFKFEYDPKTGKEVILTFILALESFHRMSRPLQVGPRVSRMRSWRFLRIWIKADRFFSSPAKTLRERRRQ
jgi:hypothetical protein